MTGPYKIVRFYRDKGRLPSLIKENVTLQEARTHCSSEDTHGDGWFDGYTEHYILLDTSTVGSYTNN